MSNAAADFFPPEASLIVIRRPPRFDVVDAVAATGRLLFGQLPIDRDEAELRRLLQALPVAAEDVVDARSSGVCRLELLGSDEHTEDDDEDDEDDDDDDV